MQVQLLPGFCAVGVAAYTRAQSGFLRDQTMVRMRATCSGEGVVPSWCLQISSKMHAQTFQSNAKVVVPKQTSRFYVSSSRRAISRHAISGTSSSPNPLARAGPSTPEPDYTDIDKQHLNQVVMALFRRKMVQAIGQDVPATGYQAIIDLTRKLNAMGSPRDTQIRTVGILASLFPSWLPGAFKVMFSRPLPEISCQLNAWATALTCQWLMGECKVNDIEVDDGKIGKGQGVKVTRCRYLEQTGCVAVCVNSCKVPTQEFFEKNMGLPLTMTPNYQDFSCQFAFGKTPGPQDTDEAFASPCFSQCPTKQRAVSSKAAAASQCHRVTVD